MKSMMLRFWLGKRAAALALPLLVASAIPGFAQDGAAPQPAAVEATPAGPSRVSVRHILISNSKENAKELADDLTAKLRQDPSQFNEFVRLHSDDRKDGGGAYTEFGRGVMVTEFEEAAFSSRPGDIAGPVETQFGYHIIQRIDPPALRLIVIAFGPAADELGTPRERTIAVQTANEAANLLREGEPFAEVAAIYSDAANKVLGGYIGKKAYRRGESYGPALPPKVMEAVVDMDRGEWRGPIYTEDAAIFVYAMADATAEKFEQYLDQTVHANLLFSRWSTAENDPTKDEARAKAEEALRRVQAGENFDELAAQLSDYQGAKEPGASAATLARRVLPPAVDQAVFALKKGEAAMVELPQGFLVVQRLDEGPALTPPTEEQKAPTKRGAQDAEKLAEDARAARLKAREEAAAKAAATAKEAPAPAETPAPAAETPAATPTPAPAETPAPAPTPAPAETPAATPAPAATPVEGIETTTESLPGGEPEAGVSSENPTQDWKDEVGETSPSTEETPAATPTPAPAE
jgi:parvulin-like peptidyl-prolyl isomerase